MEVKDEDLQLSPQFKKAILEAQKQIEKISKTYETDFTTMRNELQTRLQKYSQEAETVSDAINKDRQKEVEDMRQWMTRTE